MDNTNINVNTAACINTLYKPEPLTIIGLYTLPKEYDLEPVKSSSPSYIQLTLSILSSPR